MLLQTLEKLYIQTSDDIDNKNEAILTLTAMRIGKISLLAQGLMNEQAQAIKENRISLIEHAKKLKTDNIKVLDKIGHSIDSQYIKDRYNIGPVYRDEYEENYYERKGLTKSTIYEYSDRLYTIFTSLALLFHFILIKQNTNLWPKLELFRIGNLKYNLKICLKNIGLVWTPVFFIIYLNHVFLSSRPTNFKFSSTACFMFLIPFNFA